MPFLTEVQMKHLFRRLMLLDEPKEIRWFLVELIGLAFVIGLVASFVAGGLLR